MSKIKSMDKLYYKTKVRAFRKSKTPPRKPARLEGKVQNRGIRKQRKSKRVGR